MLLLVILVTSNEHDILLFWGLPHLLYCKCECLAPQIWCNITPKCFIIVIFFAPYKDIILAMMWLCVKKPAHNASIIGIDITCKCVICTVHVLLKAFWWMCDLTMEYACQNFVCSSHILVHGLYCRISIVKIVGMLSETICHVFL